MCIKELLERDLKDLTFLSHSKNPDIKGLALRSIPKIQEELNCLKSDQPE